MLLTAGFLIVLITQGCATSKTADRDTPTVVDPINKADQWITEHMW